jgi:Transcriptional regulators
MNIPEVTECYNTSGNFDYMLKINASDMKTYQEFLINTLGTIDSLGSIESTFVMDTVKHVIRHKLVMQRTFIAQISGNGSLKSIEE